MQATFAEPYIPSEAGIQATDLLDKALDLERKASRLAGLTAPGVARVVEEHVRAINSYYSNLIEGNNTKPWEIRQAAEGNYSADPARRDLQLESVAHMRVQAWLADQDIDRATLCSADFLREIHRVFYKGMPARMLMVKNDETGEEVSLMPGEFRDRLVKVGTHVPPEAHDLSGFMRRFEQAYGTQPLHGLIPVIAAMAAHHRLTWIHPFLDGNGRVARLFTDAYLRCIGVGGTGLWVLSRGLARSHEDYKAYLARADKPREGDRDGRGNLSERHLLALCEFMIDTALDQVDYIAKLLVLDGMIKRIHRYVRARQDGLIIDMGPLPSEAGLILERAYSVGELPRKDLYALFPRRAERTVRAAVKQLKDERLLTETSSRSPLRWAIPQHAEPYYFPELSP